MTTEQVWLVSAGAVALAALVCAVVAARAAHRAAAQVAELSARLAEREPTTSDSTRPAAARPHPDTPPYVITGLETTSSSSPPARPRTSAPAARIDGRLFSDIVARETVVRAASWGHGLRRALSPESRNRIAFQLRQQAKQSRRDRRAEAKQALREYRARQRVAEGDAA